MPQPDGSVHISVQGLGHDTTLTPDDLVEQYNEFSVSLPDGTDVYFWTRDVSSEAVLNGTSEYQFVFTFGMSDYNETTMINNRVEGVIGLQTNPDDMPVAGGAEYFGTVQGTLVETGSSTGRSTAYGDLFLDVDFVDATLDGDISNFGPNGSDQTITMDINQTDINDAQFSTD